MVRKEKGKKKKEEIILPSEGLETKSQFFTYKTSKKLKWNK